MNTDRLVRTFQELVSIDSPSFDERRMADELAGRLKELDLRFRKTGLENIMEGRQEISTRTGREPCPENRFFFPPTWIRWSRHGEKGRCFAGTAG